MVIQYKTGNKWNRFLCEYSSTNITCASNNLKVDSDYINFIDNFVKVMNINNLKSYENYLNLKIKNYINKNLDTNKKLEGKLNVNERESYKKIDYFIKNNLPDYCKAEIKLKNDCDFVKNIYELWNNPIFKGYGTEKEYPNEDLILRLSISKKDHMVIQYKENNKWNNVLCQYTEKQIYCSYLNHTITSFFYNFVGDFLKAIKFESVSYNNYNKGIELNKKVNDYNNIDRVLIITLQFLTNGTQSYLPLYKNNQESNEPGYSSLIIQKAYESRNSKIIVDIVLSNDPDIQKKINLLTPKSRLIIIGHCCKDMNLYGVDLINKKNTLSPQDIVNYLKKNGNLKNIEGFIISIYACEAGKTFCRDLSTKLFDEKIISIVKCRENPVIRLGTFADTKTAIRSYQTEEGSCSKPILFFGRANSVEYIIGKEDYDLPKNI